MTMSVSVDPFVLAPLAFAGLALCWLVVGWVWARQSTWARGVRLGPYILADKIGEGAMGEVYRAYHSGLGTWRAVKRLPRAASERDRERFEKEARLGAELRHPNAVSSSRTRSPASAPRRRRASPSCERNGGSIAWTPCWPPEPAGRRAREPRE
jgi:hypothetical protein